MDHNAMTEQIHEEQDTISNDVAISVVMVVRNEELYITEAIQSILDQTFRDFELIVVDDNSTDRTREIVNSFDDNRIHLHNNPNTPGKSGGLNHGCLLAKGGILHTWMAMIFRFLIDCSSSMTLWRKIPTSVS